MVVMALPWSWDQKLGAIEDMIGVFGEVRDCRRAKNKRVNN
jgi:hypothetical protein